MGLGDNNFNNINNVNANNQFNNNGRACGIAPEGVRDFFMITFNNLFEKLISLENLQEAYQKASKHKSGNPEVIEFEKHAPLHLAKLHKELKTKTYTPKPLQKFILRDPKTRTICVSDFRDRIIHHALVNILQPIYEPRFICDSYASRKGKGTLPAIKRLDKFVKRVTKNGQTIPNARNNNEVQGYALKADIKHYFDTVNHEILLSILAQRVKDENVLWLTKVILDHYNSGIPGKGMPLGNWTSQFFANIYLNELDQFIKHKLKAKQYIRYVDDFVILHQNKTILIKYEQQIKAFLKKLKLELHPDKCKIIPLKRGVSFLGFRTYYHHRLILQRNLRKILNRLKEMLELYKCKSIDAYDIDETLHGWSAYAMQANTYRLRQRLTEDVHNQLCLV